MFRQLVEKILKEYNYTDVMRKQRSITKLFPSFYDRVKAVGNNGGIRMEEMLPETWRFKVQSGTKSEKTI